MVASRKASTSKGDLIGGWAFLIGLVLAIILGAMGRIDGAMSTILVLLGLIVMCHFLGIVFLIILFPFCFLLLLGRNEFKIIKNNNYSI